MKNVKILLSVALAFAGVAAMAQDLSDPKYAAWGETVQEREQNLLNSNFLKEACDNRNYDQAAHYFKELIDKCPEASMSIYQRGAMLYKNKINRAKTLAEKNMFVDSLMLTYDLRVKYFGDNPKTLITTLDNKAREMLQYKPSDRAAIRKAFQAALEAAGDAADPETVVAYFSNLCDDYKNTDEITPDYVIAEYERLEPFFAKNPEAGEYKNQFDAAFGLSGVASCENLEKLFTAKLAANPNDENVLSQAVALMTRAKCDTEFYFTVAEKYHAVKPTSQTAMFLAQAFQNRKDFDKAIKYLTEALAVETDPTERENLYVRIALAELVSNDMSGAASAARKAIELNPSNGQAYFVLGQCYNAAAAACPNFPGQAYWVAYDTMAKAVELLPADSEYLPHAKTALSAFRARFPTAEECFFNELKEGTRYTVNCGMASGVVTTVRAR